VLLFFVLLPLRPGREAADFPVSEDGFFSMTVARNIAHGNGVTIDGEQLTNGFQPLFTFVTVPLFAGNDKLLSVRFLFFFQIVIFGLTAYLLGKLIYEFLKEFYPDTDKSLQWLIALMYLAGQTVIIKHLNGLETGFYMFMIVLTAYYYFRYYRDDFKSRLMFGVLMGLTVLTRIDFAFFVVIFTVAILFEGKDNFAERMKRAVTVSLTAFLVSLPWWIYNYTVFGSVMPISGQAQQRFELDLYRIFWSVYAVANNFEIFTTKTEAFVDERLLLAVRLMFIAAVFYFVRPLIAEIKSRFATAASERFLRFIFILFVFSVSLIIWYTISNWAVYFYQRYFMPLVIVSVFVLSLALLKTVTRYKTMISLTAVIFPLMSAVFVMIVFYKIGMNGSGFLNNQLPLIEEHVPKTEKVAAGQTGTIGYFLDNVVNLDGKVNYEALAYRNNMWDYLDKKKIAWFCDWELGVKRFLGVNPGQNGWEFIDKRGDFLLYHKKHK